MIALFGEILLHMGMSQPILLLDFDGTVCVGDEPVRRYAAYAAAALDDPALLLGELDHYLSDSPHVRLELDGYQLVQAVGTRLGIDHAALDSAFHRSRADLMAPGFPLRTPAGLADFLRSLRSDVRIVLATNSPATSMDVVLKRLGVADYLHEVIVSAGKPGNMGAIVDQLLATSTNPPNRLLSVGDIWTNDLQAPLERGCTVAYIDRFGHDEGPAHLRARTFDALYPAITTWAKGNM
jgi:FMN phosphatase YigB (HAD superfamily)